MLRELVVGVVLVGSLPNSLGYILVRFNIVFDLGLIWLGLGRNGEVHTLIDLIFIEILGGIEIADQVFL